MEIQRTTCLRWELYRLTLRLLDRHGEIVRIDPWYSGDHSLFWPRAIPSLALTSAGAFDYGREHTVLDRLEQVDPARIDRTVRFVGDLIHVLQKMPVHP